MLAVEIATRPTFSHGGLHALFAGSYAMDPIQAGIPNYDVSRDGRFLMGTTDEADVASTSMHVVLNWFEELKARVPTP